MSSSFTLSESTTFTLTHARHIAAKVATDLKRIQRLYGAPSDNVIDAYEAELIELLKAGYLDTATYGFLRGDEWIEPTIRYTARDLAGIHANDDDPGRILPGADTRGASFGSYVVFSSAWDEVSETARAAFKARSPVTRVDGPQPGFNGCLTRDRSYTAGGKTLERATLKGY